MALHQPQDNGPRLPEPILLLKLCFWCMQDLAVCPHAAADPTLLEGEDAANGE